VEFNHLYTLSRNESALFALPLLKRLEARWPPLAQSLREAGVEAAAVEHVERHMAVRLNSLLESGEPLGFAPRLPVAVLSKHGDSAARKLRSAIEDYARKALRTKGLPFTALRGLPFEQLDAFGKLLILLPDSDPAWRELGAWAAARAAAGKPVAGREMQGVLGEIIAARTPGVLAYFRDETQKVLRQNPTLLKEGWRVVFQPNSVKMAQRSKALEKGAQLAEEGLIGSGLSFDLSVWFVHEEKLQAMPVLRAQVKAGVEETVLKGATQSLVSDEWRMFSGPVTLQVSNKANHFELRPPDSFTSVRVLIGADVPPAGRFAPHMPAMSTLDVFELPMSGKEFGMLGVIMSKEMAKLPR
jgi:hypothetical protein